MSATADKVDAQAWHWPGKLFSAEDLRRHWRDQRELVLTPHALLTPLAADELRARGIQVTRCCANKAATVQASWGYVEERPDALVTAAAVALKQAGALLTALTLESASLGGWYQALGEWVHSHAGSVLFRSDAAGACCVANRIRGLRAAVVVSVVQARRALDTVGANVLIVEMPGRTFFEIRQILALVAGAGTPVCPAPAAELLLELEGHAHR